MDVRASARKLPLPQSTGDLKMRNTIDMAREAGAKTPRSIWPPTFAMSIDFTLEALKAFEALVRADERTRTWTQEHWTEYERSIAAVEREACAKLAQETICDTHIPTNVNIYGTRVAKAIRARGQA
jgi:hypothetical protein